MTHTLQKQLEDLWNLVQLKERDVKQLEDRIALVQNHSKVSHLLDHFEPIVKEAIGWVNNSLKRMFSLICY